MAIKPFTSKEAPEILRDAFKDANIVGNIGFIGSDKGIILKMTEFHLKLLVDIQGETDLNKIEYTRFLIETCPFIEPEIKKSMLEDVVKCGNSNLLQRRFPHRYYKYLEYLCGLAGELQSQ